MTAGVAPFFSLSAFDIAQGAGVLVRDVQRSAAGRAGHVPLVLLLAPPPVATLTYFDQMFEGADAKSQKLGHNYRLVAEELGCAFLDTSTVITSSNLDGIHFEAAEHARLGEAVARLVMGLV